MGDSRYVTRNLGRHPSFVAKWCDPKCKYFMKHKVLRVTRGPCQVVLCRKAMVPIDKLEKCPMSVL